MTHTHTQSQPQQPQPPPSPTTTTTPSTPHRQFAYNNPISAEDVLQSKLWGPYPPGHGNTRFKEWKKTFEVGEKGGEGGEGRGKGKERSWG